ncbi:hypothetical protein V3481_019218 [Fusarium oxysporum f. sp. vasinfectum]
MVVARLWRLLEDADDVILLESASKVIASVVNVVPGRYTNLGAEILKAERQPARCRGPSITVPVENDMVDSQIIEDVKNNGNSVHFSTYTVRYPQINQN